MLTCTRAHSQVKKTDPGNEVVPLESICMSIVGTARSMGIDIVR